MWLWNGSPEWECQEAHKAQAGRGNRQSYILILSENMQKRQVYRSSTGTAYFTNTGEARVDFPQLLKEAKDAGHKFKEWYRGRRARKLAEKVEDLKIKERELALMKEIDELQKNQK